MGRIKERHIDCQPGDCAAGEIEYCHVQMEDGDGEDRTDEAKEQEDHDYEAYKSGEMDIRYD